MTAAKRKLPRPAEPKELSDFGTRLDEARVQLGKQEGKEVSWNEVARRAHVHGGYVSKAKYGERNPKWAIAMKLASALGCDVTWLASGQGAMYPARQLTAGREKPAKEPPGRSEIREILR